MSNPKAYAAQAPVAPLAESIFDRRSPKPYDVQIDFCFAAGATVIFPVQ